MSISGRRKQRVTKTTAVPSGLVVTVQNTGGGSVRVSWTYPSDPSGGWTVGRDGVDSTGYGAWSTTVGGATRELVFTKLRIGATYTFTVAGDGKTAAKTITVAPDALTNFTARAASTTSISLSWTYSGTPAAENFTLYRDDVQIATLPATSTSYLDENLAEGSSHRYKLVATLIGGGTSNTATVYGYASGGTSGLYPPHVLWLSGNSDSSASQGATLGFGTFRGEPIRYVTAWDAADDTSLGAMTQYTNRGYDGVLHNSKHAPNGWSWASAAGGGYDWFYNSYADALISRMTTMREVHAGFGFELNGSWFAVSIVRGQSGQLAQLGNFGAGWKRYANIIRQKAAASGKNIKICLNLTWDTHGDASVKQIVQAAGTDYFDFLGVDYYDAYKPTWNTHLNNDSDWNNEFYRTKHGGDTPVGLGAWVEFAQSIGKPITFPEWGLSDNRSLGPFDNPYYIEKMNNFFRSIRAADPGVPQPGKLYGEAYFNAESIGYLWPNTHMPNSRDKYRDLSWGQ